MANEVMNVVPQEMEITRPGFESEKGFALLQRMAKMFSMSSIYSTRSVFAWLNTIITLFIVVIN